MSDKAAQETKTMSSETEKSVHEDRRIFTAEDMLHAFRHGLEFKQRITPDDISQATPDEHLPFWEWLERYIDKE